MSKDKARGLEPETLAKFLERATALHGEGRLDEAARLYEHIHACNPEQLSAQYFLATIDIETGRLSRALDRLRKLTRKDSSFEPVFALGFTFGELGEWQQAVECFRRALATKPQSTSARFALANALEVTGGMDQAIAHYRSLAELPLVRLRALIGIARLKPSQINLSERAEMSAAAVDEMTPTGLRIGLQFALGEILEACREYDDAFMAFAEGNRLRRENFAETADATPEIVIAPPSSRARAHSPEKVAAGHAETIAHRKEVFAREFLERHSGNGHASKAPIFIVGMPRSGSTLIEQILSSHRQVEGLGEVPGIWKTVQGSRFFGRGHEPSELDMDHPRKLAENYLSAQRDYGWRKSPFFVDKMLGNYLNIGFIHLMFPDATILHSVRDPVDTCVACFRQLFRTGNETTYNLRDIGAHYVRYREMMAHWEAVLPPGRIRSVVHEDLVVAPDTRIRWLVEEACELKWDDNCLRFYETKRPVRTASVAQVRQPMFRASMERWRKYAVHLEPLFEALGPYAPDV